MPTTQKPRKAILSQEQLTQFQESQCHKDIVAYIESLNASVTGVKLSDDCPQSSVSQIVPWIANRSDDELRESVRFCHYWAEWKN